MTTKEKKEVQLIIEATVLLRASMLLIAYPERACVEDRTRSIHMGIKHTNVIMPSWLMRKAKLKFRPPV
jgi:hypothetical protein